MSEEFSRTDLQKAILFNQALGSVRRQLLDGMSTHGGKRQFNIVLGYPEEITTDQYLTRYYRQDIAGRIVDLPATDTWKDPPKLTQGNEEETEFIKAIKQLVEKLRLWSVITRADRISGIGTFGGIFIGYKDGLDPAEEAIKGSAKNPDGVLFMRPFSAANAKVKTFVTDTQSERFGLPLMYQLTVENNKTIDVHWTRILHIADNRIDSDWEGIPRLQQVWNRLDDLYKVVGGSAEASWLNMRPGTVITTQKDATLDLDDDEVKEGIEAEIEEYIHGMMRFLTLEGIDVKQLQGQMMDPKSQFEVEIALISAASGIPQRVLLGSAAGELAAAQEDTKQWYGTITSRQANYAEPDILRPLLAMFVWIGAIPDPGEDGYEVEWVSLFEASDQENALTAETWAKAVSAMGAEVSNKEKRVMLNLPDEIPDDMRDLVEPVIPTATDVENVAPESLVVAAAARNLAKGLITNEQYQKLLEGLLEDFGAADSE